jgi:hypothetical protein
MSTPDQDRPELVPLIDLQPHEAEAVVDAMNNVGLEAVPYRVDPGAREGTMAKALIRLYVPRTQLRDARAVVRGVLPEYGATAADTPPETLASGEEKAWADIVAELRSDGFAEPAAPPPAHHPDPPERFTPPEPPPIPRLHRYTILSWIGLLGGIAVAIFGASVFGGGTVALLGMGMFVAGFVSLIYRMRERDADDYDDGAVV